MAETKGSRAKTSRTDRSEASRYQERLEWARGEHQLVAHGHDAHARTARLVSAESAQELHRALAAPRVPLKRLAYLAAVCSVDTGELRYQAFRLRSFELRCRAATSGRPNRPSPVVLTDWPDLLGLAYQGETDRQRKAERRAGARRSA